MALLSLYEADLEVMRLEKELRHRLRNSLNVKALELHEAQQRVGGNDVPGTPTADGGKRRDAGGGPARYDDKRGDVAGGPTPSENSPSR